jgi:hypothetical protein
LPFHGLTNVRSSRNGNRCFPAVRHLCDADAIAHDSWMFPLRVMPKAEICAMLPVNDHRSVLRARITMTGDDREKNEIKRNAWHKSSTSTV